MIDKVKVKKLHAETHISYTKLLAFFRRKKNNLSLFELQKLDKATDELTADVGIVSKRIKALIELESL